MQAVFFDERVTVPEMEAASGEEQSWKPEDEDGEVPLAGYVAIFCLLGLVCLASYVLWRLHRKRSDGLEGLAHVESTAFMRPSRLIGRG